jgi:RHS repeat-associated protein
MFSTRSSTSPLEETPVFFGESYTKPEEGRKVCNNYSTFGAPMPERTWNSGNYRYGFNSQEKDDEIKGEGNSINYLARIQDTRLGRFLSVDPLTKSFPMLTPYQFASNTPIQAVDLDGKEALHYQYQIRSLITGEIAGVTGSVSIGIILDKNLKAIMTATVSGGIAGGVAPIIGGSSATYYHTASSYKDVLGHGFNAGIFLSKNPAGVKPIAGYEVNLSFREEDGSSIGGVSKTFEFFSFGKGGGVYAEYANTFAISEPFNLLDGAKTIMEKTGFSSEAASDLIKNLQNQLEQSIKNHQSENLSIPQMIEKGWTVPAEAIDTHNKLQEIGNSIGNSMRDIKKDEKK